MKHELIKKLYHEWQNYNNEYFNEFIYFNEFLESKGYVCDILAVGKKNLVIYRIKIENLSYLITDYGITIEIQYQNEFGKFINIYKYL